MSKADARRDHAPAWAGDRPSVLLRILSAGVNVRAGHLLAIALMMLLGAAIDAQQAVGPRRYILAAGRRLPYVYVISLEAALDPANDRTAKAIVGRSKVATESLDGRLLGDPANLVVSEDQRTLYVVNHHGAVDNGTFRQHGGRGQIAVLDIDDLLAPGNDGTATALRRHMDSGGFGALGLVLLPEVLVIANAENNLTEDGGNRITLVDRRTGSLRGTVELALGTPGFPCPDYPVPYCRRTGRRGTSPCVPRTLGGAASRTRTGWRSAAPPMAAPTSFQPTAAPTTCP